jgi:hypothetical protein
MASPLCFSAPPFLAFVAALIVSAKDGGCQASSRKFWIENVAVVRFDFFVLFMSWVFDFFFASVDIIISAANGLGSQSSLKKSEIDGVVLNWVCAGSSKGAGWLVCVTAGAHIAGIITAKASMAIINAIICLMEPALSPDVHKCFRRFDGQKKRAWDEFTSI